MQILIIYPNSFPYSGAATNRIISIARGLVENGSDVKLIINRPTEKNKNSKNNKVEGIYKGIKFRYASNSLLWPDSKIKKFIAYTRGLTNTIILLLQTKKIDVIISAATTGFVENLIYYLISRFKKAKFVHTLDEYPWVVLRKDDYNKFYRWFYLKYFYKLFDGFIIMTQTLLDYYKPICRRKAKLIHIPMSVELDRFDIAHNKSEFGDYIAYCGGDKSGDKDGVDILVKAFNLVKDDFPNLHLLIIGHVHPKIEKIILNFDLSKRVRLLGFVNSDVVPQYLKNAKALCLARPANKQAEGGFPTKLGEYLASGVPVIVTNVGEISNYLEDNESAYIAKPDSIADFADKIRQVINDKGRSKKIGEKGKMVAENNFDYFRQGNEMNRFLREIL